MPCCSSVLKPGAVIFTSYLPIGRLAATNCPASLVFNVRTVPVLSCKTVTSAFGTAAPVGSVTVPTIVPSWAEARHGNSKTTKTRITQRNGQPTVSAVLKHFEHNCISTPPAHCVDFNGTTRVKTVNVNGYSSFI